MCRSAVGWSGLKVWGTVNRNFFDRMGEAKTKNNSKKVVVIGGGTGTYTALMGLKHHPVELSAIISMMDSGGSNRVIRDEFGLLPTSDIRQCIVALASDESSDILRKLFTYRYEQGTGISGMTFGNLFMAALTDIMGTQREAIKKTCELLDVKGQIIPVTYDDVHLVARYDNGQQVLGEHYIDEPDDGIAKHRIVEFTAIPNAKVSQNAVQAVTQADLIVLGPGDLYTSIICNLIVEGMADAIVKSKAKVVLIMNLMTRWGQTSGFSAQDHLDEINKYLGKLRVDYVLINKDGEIPEEVIKRYEEERAHPVEDDLNNSSVKVVRKSFVSSKIFKKSPSDKLMRSLMRHDPKKLAKSLMALLD